jgi:hypothetical protein
MILGALASPLFLILLACMAITASLELGPARWVPAVLEAGKIPGILVLAYVFGLMAILRFFAGPVVRYLSPTGILVGSAILAGVGLYWFSFAETTTMAFVSATVWAIGICYFWPTMLGVTSERVPRSGEFGLALMGGMGMLVVGVLTTPQMGRVADRFLHEQLVQKQAATLAVLERIVEVYPPLAEKEREPFRTEILRGVNGAPNAPGVRKVLAAAQAGNLPEGETAAVLRYAAKNAPKGKAAEAVVKQIDAVLKPADNFGGRMSFRYVAPFALVIMVVFGAIYLRDRATGGYKAQRLLGRRGGASV